MDRATLLHAKSTISLCHWVLIPRNERRLIANCYTDRETSVISTCLNDNAETPLGRFVVDKLGCHTPHRCCPRPRRSAGQRVDDEAHINRLVSTCFYYLRRLRLLKRHVNRDVMKQLVSAFILSRLDYCNSVLVVCRGQHCSTTTCTERSRSSRDVET